MPCRSSILGFSSLLWLSGCMGDAGPGIAPPPASADAAPSIIPSPPETHGKLVPSEAGASLSPAGLTPRTGPN